MDVGKAGYAAILIAKFFKNHEKNEADIFAIEAAVCNKCLNYTDMLYGLTLLYAIDVLNSDGVIIHMREVLSDKHLLGLSHLILI